jgi:membrane protein YdbS with pleckstrin-like domain
VGYLEDLLADGEQVEYETHKHWVAPLFSTVSGSMLALGGLVALVWQFFTDTPWVDNVLRWGGLVVLLIGVTMLARAFVIWWSEQYFVTNQKVMKISGILRKTAEGSALEKINDIKISQTLLGRMLGFGTLQVLTAADESNLTYTAMRAPMEFRRVILNQKQTLEHADARHIAEAVRQSQEQYRPAVRTTAELPAVGEPSGPSKTPALGAGASEPGAWATDPAGAPSGVGASPQEQPAAPATAGPAGFPPIPPRPSAVQPGPTAASSGPLPAPAPGPSATQPGPQTAQGITDLIERLADLRDKGAITTEEFEAKKAELLGRL